MVKNRIQLLKEIEQNIEQEISFLGGRFKTINDLKNYEKNKKKRASRSEQDSEFSRSKSSEIFYYFQQEIFKTLKSL